MKERKKERKKMVSVHFVRHGQSTNNVVLASLIRQRKEGTMSGGAFERLWMERRNDDPALTSKGIEEAKQLGAFLSRRGGLRNATFFCSPMQRTCETTLHMTENLGICPKFVIVHPDIYETGGIYTSGKGGQRVGPGKCLSAHEIRERFAYDTSLLPAFGGWYKGSWETDGEGRHRAKRVADWLTSESFHNHHKGRTVVLVMHAHFIDQLTKQLLCIKDDPRLDGMASNNVFQQRVKFFSPNTAMSTFDISPRSVAMRLFGSTEHLEASASFSRL